MENTCTQGPGHARILAWILKKSGVLITAQWAHQFLVWWSSFLLICLQILANTNSMCIWVLSLMMGAFCFLDVWKSWVRCFSWQQIKRSESSEGHSPNRWKKVVAAVLLEGVRWRHKLLNTRGPSVSLRALVTKLNSEALVKHMYATMQANACDMTSRCIPHCNWMNATLPNYTYYNANSWFQHCKR